MWLSIFGHTGPQTVSQSANSQARPKKIKENKFCWDIYGGHLDRNLTAKNLPGCQAAKERSEPPEQGAGEPENGNQRGDVRSHTPPQRLKMELCSSERNIAAVSPCVLWRNLLSLDKDPIISSNYTLHCGWDSEGLAYISVTSSSFLLLLLWFMLLNDHLPRRTVFYESSCFSVFSLLSWQLF